MLRVPVGTNPVASSCDHANPPYHADASAVSGVPSAAWNTTTTRPKLLLFSTARIHDVASYCSAPPSIVVAHAETSTTWSSAKSKSPVEPVPAKNDCAPPCGATPLPGAATPPS